jgi:hypothetical protein
LPARTNSSAWPSLSRISWRECFFIVLSSSTRRTATATHRVPFVRLDSNGEPARLQQKTSMCGILSGAYFSACKVLSVTRNVKQGTAISYLRMWPPLAARSFCLAHRVAERQPPRH